MDAKHHESKSIKFSFVWLVAVVADVAETNAVGIEETGRFSDWIRYLEKGGSDEKYLTFLSTSRCSTTAPMVNFTFRWIDWFKQQRRESFWELVLLLYTVFFVWCKTSNKQKVNVKVK